jgi:hypothetical protein
VAWVNSETSNPRKTRGHLVPDPSPGTDAYAPSRALFDTLITRLSDPQMAERPEHAVEEFIAGSGRDVCQGSRRSRVRWPLVFVVGGQQNSMLVVR